VFVAVGAQLAKRVDIPAGRRHDGGRVSFLHDVAPRKTGGRAHVPSTRRQHRDGRRPVAAASAPRTGHRLPPHSRADARHEESEDAEREGVRSTGCARSAPSTARVRVEVMELDDSVTTTDRRFERWPPTP